MNQIAQKEYEETLCSVYTEDPFKEYVKEKYVIEKEQVFNNSTVL
jgi:hypothetical protein